MEKENEYEDEEVCLDCNGTGVVEMRLEPDELITKKCICQLELSE